MNTRKIILSAAVIAVMLTGFSSHAIADGSDMINRMTSQLKQQLSLSDDQVSRIEAILQNGLNSPSSVTKDTSIEGRRKNFEIWRGKMMELQKKIFSVLTDEQKRRFEKLKD